MGHEVVKPSLQRLEVLVEPVRESFDTGEGLRGRSRLDYRQNRGGRGRLSRVSGMSISAAFHGSHPFVGAGPFVSPSLRKLKCKVRAVEANFAADLA